MSGPAVSAKLTSQITYQRPLPKQRCLLVTPKMDRYPIGILGRLPSRISLSKRRSLHPAPDSWVSNLARETGNKDCSPGQGERSRIVKCALWTKYGPAYLEQSVVRLPLDVAQIIKGDNMPLNPFLTGLPVSTDY